jgi:hypothetical protein
VYGGNCAVPRKGDWPLTSPDQLHCYRFAAHQTLGCPAAHESRPTNTGEKRNARHAFAAEAAYQHCSPLSLACCSASRGPRPAPSLCPSKRPGQWPFLRRDRATRIRPPRSDLVE